MRCSVAGDRALVPLEYFTGIPALAGGMMLAVRRTVRCCRPLDGSPFSNWRVPGILLAVLVGGGFLLTAESQRRHLPHARELSIFAGVGLMVFELTEVLWIGFQPLEAVFGVVGAAVTVLAVRKGSSMPQLPGIEQEVHKMPRHVGSAKPWVQQKMQPESF